MEDDDHLKPVFLWKQTRLLGNIDWQWNRENLEMEANFLIPLNTNFHKYSLKIDLDNMNKKIDGKLEEGSINDNDFWQEWKADFFSTA